MFKKAKNWIIGLIGLGGVAGGVYYQQTTSERSAETTSVKPRIDITTTDSKPLEIVFGANFIDFNFLGTPQRNTIRNLTDTVCLKINGALGFQRSAFTFGSGVQYFHWVDSGGVGYCMREQDFASRREYETYGNGVASTDWAADFSVLSAEYSSVLPIGFDLCLNPVHGTWNESLIALKRFNPKVVGIGCETQTTLVSPQEYAGIVELWGDSLNKYYPDAAVVIDAGLLYRTNPTTEEWNKYMQTISLQNKNVWYRYYCQLGDRAAFNANQDSNVIKVNFILDSLLVRDIERGKQLFPNWKMCIEQMNIEDVRGTDTFYINNKAVGNYALGRMYETFIKNQDYIKAAYWMSLKNLIGATDSTNNNYATLSMLNSIMKANEVTQITFTTMDGVTGISLKNGTTNYILINNQSPNTYTTDQIYVNGGRNSKKIIYNIISRYSRTWDMEVIQQATTSNVFSIPPYGVSVVEFTK